VLAKVQVNPTQFELKLATGGVVSDGFVMFGPLPLQPAASATTIVVPAIEGIHRMPIGTATPAPALSFAAKQ
jgi:hypothetical protein